MDLALTENGLAGARGRGGGLPAATALYENLRARIVGLDLKPDATLSRSDLAEQYGVSQTPVREALQRLEQDGLVKIYPQSRTLVSRIVLKQLYEAHFLRVGVECEVVRRLTLEPNPQAIAKARSIVAMQEAIVDDLSQVQMFNDLDEAFHQTLLDGVGQGDLYLLIKQRSGQLARARRLDLPRKAKLDGILADHKAILAGIDAGSEEQAVAAVRAHLSGTIDRIDILRAEHPDFFEG